MNISGISNGTCGTVYFKDGHTEAILYLVHYKENMIIEVHTCSGRYLYYSFIFIANANVPVNYTSHLFYKSVISADDFGHLDESLVLCDAIDHIEIYK